MGIKEFNSLLTGVVLVSYYKVYLTVDEAFSEYFLVGTMHI